MIQFDLFIPAPLRPLVGGQETLVLQAAEPNLAAAMLAVVREYPQLARCLLQADGQVREEVSIFVGDRDQRFAGGMAAPLSAEETVTIIVAECV